MKKRCERAIDRRQAPNLGAAARDVKQPSAPLATENRRIGAHDGVRHARDGDGGEQVDVRRDLDRVSSERRVIGEVGKVGDGDLGSRSWGRSLGRSSNCCADEKAGESGHHGLSSLHFVHLSQFRGREDSPEINVRARLKATNFLIGG